MPNYDLNSARDGAAAMVKVLDETITDLKRRLAMQEKARDALRPLASEPEVKETFRPGRDVLRQAMQAADRGDDGDNRGTASFNGSQS